ncbi:MAG: addiction module protein [Acidobacteriota bacterium]
MAKLNINVNELSREERLALIEELWDSLAGQPEELPLTQAQRQELDRRIDEMDGDDTLGIPWEEVLRQIREQR